MHFIKVVIMSNKSFHQSQQLRCSVRNVVEPPIGILQDPGNRFSLTFSRWERDVHLHVHHFLMIRDVQADGEAPSAYSPTQKKQVPNFDTFCTFSDLEVEIFYPKISLVELYKNRSRICFQVIRLLRDCPVHSLVHPTEFLLYSSRN